MDPAPFDDLVDRATRGDAPALEALMPLVYAELRRLAAHYLKGERPGQTLQPTALVHEAYLKLLKDRPERWQNRAHFCAIAAHAMRQILIERARARDALKRGGGQPRVTFDRLELYDGIGLVPVVMGLFGIAEVLHNLERPIAREVIKTKLSQLWPNRAEWRASAAPVARSSRARSAVSVTARPPRSNQPLAVAYP